MLIASFWLSGSVGGYVPLIRPLLPENIQFFDCGYGCSEAKINIPMAMNTPVGVLGIFSEFYEFLPMEGGIRSLPGNWRMERSMMSCLQPTQVCTGVSRGFCRDA